MFLPVSTRTPEEKIVFEYGPMPAVVFTAMCSIQRDNFQLVILVYLGPVFCVS